MNKQQAKATLAKMYGPNYLFGDTETTGLSKTSELVEIAITDHEGNVLMDTLIKPKGEIPKVVSDIHGIFAEDVKDSPSWADVHEQFLEVLGDKTLVFYNRSFDLRLIKQTAGLYGLGGIEFEEKIEDQTVCAMKPYAVFNGELTKTGAARSVKLVVAAEQEGVVMTDFSGGAHRALFDSVMVQRMVKNLASGNSKEEALPLQNQKIKTVKLRAACSPICRGKIMSFELQMDSPPSKPRGRIDTKTDGTLPRIRMESAEGVTYKTVKQFQEEFQEMVVNRATLKYPAAI